MRASDRDRKARYHNRALGAKDDDYMPRYNVQCQFCLDERELKLTFHEYDQLCKGFIAYCEDCESSQEHKFVIRQAPGLEWRTDGATSVDWADPFTKYQREHFAESGDRSDKKKLERDKRRARLTGEQPS